LTARLLAAFAAGFLVATAIAAVGRRHVEPDGASPTSSCAGIEANVSVLEEGERTMGSKEEELIAAVRKAIRQLKQLLPGGVPGPLSVAELLEDALHRYSPDPAHPITGLIHD